MKLYVFLGIILSSIVSAENFAQADSLPSTEISNQVPYKKVSLDDPVLKEIWIRKGEDDYWWQLKDDTRQTYIASFKNDKGQNVLISQWVDHYGCAEDNCPVRVIVDGNMIYQDAVCINRASHTLTGNRNAVFLCDEVIPLELPENKEKK